MAHSILLSTTTLKVITPPYLQFVSSSLSFSFLYSLTFIKGYRGNPQQYQYAGQNGYPQGYPGFSPEGDPSQPVPTDSTSPPTYPAYATAYR